MCDKILILCPWVVVAVNQQCLWMLTEHPVRDYIWPSVKITDLVALTQLEFACGCVRKVSKTGVCISMCVCLPVWVGVISVAVIKW